MFPDVNEDNVHADAINCIAYYGITAGKLDGTYAPDEHVSAFQMGHFVRAAANLMGADGDAVLSGVMLSDTVTRLEMAQLMFGLLDDLHDWIRINARSGNIEFNRDGWAAVDDFFADARAQVPIAESDLIGAAFELGVTRGRSVNVSTNDSVFAPSDPVTRAQMASFITRALDHSNLRPEGLAVQRNLNRETQISLRDGDFQPVENARVDVFSSRYAADAFDERDGECEFRFVRDETPSFDPCLIDIGDQLTDDDGNIDFRLVSDDPTLYGACAVAAGSDARNIALGTGESRSFWAWTGDLRDEVDEDTDLGALEDVARPFGSDPAAVAVISGGLPTSSELAKMGETVSFDVQMSTAGRSGQPETRMPASPDRSGNPYLLRIQKYYVEANASAAADSPIPGYDILANTSAADGTRSTVSGDARMPFHTPFDSVVFPNSDGQFTISLDNADNSATRDDPHVGVRFTLTPFPGNDQLGSNLLSEIAVWPSANHATGNSATDPRAVGYAVFSDDASVPTSARAASLAGYQLTRPGGTPNSLTVTVTDQYGDPFRNAAVSVTSSLDNAAEASDNARYPEEVDVTVQSGENNADGSGSDSDTVGSFNTRRNGQVRIGYAYTGSDVAAERVVPSVAEVTGDNPDTPDDTETDFVLRAGIDAGTAAYVFFANAGDSFESSNDDGTTNTAVDILVVDVHNRAIVVQEGATATSLSAFNPMVYYYDDADVFTVGGADATFEMFERALALTWDNDRAYPAQLKWDSYDRNRPRDRANIELTLSCTEPSDLPTS